ncbi:sel1 repeat family protein [Novosphingobium sp. KA1]|uniref:sel1 repeat family protein n=1 Tax=Novosphingobium sp. (strain KA1) TaxID=164608 RepID=UPI001A9085FC|nr:sel1 repeat family protein [Novosphingobium sp. KA1]
MSDKLAVMARCSIVGHIIAKSPYGDRSQPLRGVDTFFNNEPLEGGEMFGIFGQKPKDGPPNSVGEAKKLIERLGQSRGGEIIRAGALAGNVFCQIFLSQAGLSIPKERRNDKLQHDLVMFTEMAAKSGDAGSQFNLGKLYMDKIDASAEYLDQDDIDNIKQAKYWYGMASRQGLPEAIRSLKNLEVFDF